MKEVKLCSNPVVSYPNLDEKVKTVFATPKWNFSNVNKVFAGNQFPTMSVKDIAAVPVDTWVEDNAHCYLSVPNCLLAEGLQVMKAWGFRYVSKIDLIQTNKDGDVARNGFGFYFRNASETILFGVRGKLRTLAPARSMINLIYVRKGQHGVIPDELYEFMEMASPGSYLELFAQSGRKNWRSISQESFPTAEMFKAA